MKKRLSKLSKEQLGSYFGITFDNKVTKAKRIEFILNTFTEKALFTELNKIDNVNSMTVEEWWAYMQEDLKDVKGDKFINNLIDTTQYLGK